MEYTRERRFRSFVCFVQLKHLVQLKHNLLAQVGQAKLNWANLQKQIETNFTTNLSFVFYAPSNWPSASMIDFKAFAARRTDS